MIVVGIGPGNLKYASVEAISMIKEAECVVAFTRVAEDIKGLNKVTVINSIEEVLKYRDACLVVSGDPLLYSITEVLIKNGVEIQRIVPSISSFQYMMARLGKAWSNANIISFHGRDFDGTRINPRGINVIFTDRKNTPSVISKKLFEYGFKGFLYIGYNLSYDNEVILKKRIGETVEDISELALVVMEGCG
ncbi:MAG: precorrin-6y C5,15-methyltransferase (decarboxylating) subunit CbiE [Candidatus Nanoarchaeia archaeon]|nr:precorrin-6y C5,15-methyltransferase (decarboxylating) subunit CbiE [Candidatus Jingweiarchaeum tengchongense]